MIKMKPFNWTCHYCNRDTIISSENFNSGYECLLINNKHGNLRANIRFIVCPNPECKEVSLYLDLNKARASKDTYGTSWVNDELIKSWTLMPASEAKVLPSYVPKAIIDDYNEACLIRELSPKASATLSRRCLQGIIRDFWKISKSRLVDEIEAIKDKVDPLTWGAIDAVRKIGNIGAHMEKDINQMIDVEPSEALLLIELIETLIKDWYVARHERELRLKRIIDTKDKKELEKKK